MTKKKQEAVDPMANALSVMGAQAKAQKMGGVNFSTVAQTAAKWCWIDFVDPKTGLPLLLLEWLWGARGMLAGRVLKLEAEEGVGKSSYCMLQYAMGQQSSAAWCVHMEGEAATAPADFIASFGCDPNKVITPELDIRAIDECFNKIDWVAHTIRRPPANEKDKNVIDPGMAHPIIVGVDSISSFGAAKNMEDDATDLDTGQGGLGLHSRFLSQWFRDRWTVQERRNVLLMAVTQLRDVINTQPSFPGAPQPQKGGKTTIAARPLNYHASYRLEMRSKPYRPPQDGKDYGDQVGEIVTMTTTKNKLSPKGKQIQVPLVWGHGFQFTQATIDKLCELSPLPLRGGYQFEVKKTGKWLQCPAVSDKSISFEKGEQDKVGLDFLHQLCAKTDLLMCIREALRVRGFGFEFETNYMPSAIEIDDNSQSEAEAAAAGGSGET